MPTHISVNESLADGIITRVETLMLEAEEQMKPLEIDPFREQLFELFVTAEGAGLIDEKSNPDLTSDGLCRTLSLKWGLAEATRDSIEQQKKMSPEQLSRMRLLWSVMRMWMEWSYAWERWAEFHGGEADA